MKRPYLAAICCAVLTVEGSTLLAGQPACDCECKRANPVLNVLDRVASGIDKLLDFKICGPGASSSGCDACLPSYGDDGCDAMTMQELMMMSEPEMMYHPPLNSHSAAAPAIPTPPNAEDLPAPSSTPAQTPIRMMPAQINPITEARDNAPSKRETPRTAPMGSGVRPEREAAEGSMFDILQDPFKDDSVQWQQSGNIQARPAGYRPPIHRARRSR